jgi:hypothetical protein
MICLRVLKTSTRYLSSQGATSAPTREKRTQRYLHDGPNYYTARQAERAERRSDASKAAIIATLRDRVKRLEAENREQRAQLEVAYGRFLEGP